MMPRYMLTNSAEGGHFLHQFSCRGRGRRRRAAAVVHLRRGAAADFSVRGKEPLGPLGEPDPLPTAHRPLLPASPPAHQPTSPPTSLPTHLELWVQVGVGAEGEDGGVEVGARVQRHFLLVEREAQVLHGSGDSIDKSNRQGSTTGPSGSTVGIRSMNAAISSGK